MVPCSRPSILGGAVASSCTFVSLVIPLLLGSSPRLSFTASHFKEYTLLRCPSGTSLEEFTPIRCLSNSSSSVIAIGLESAVKSMTSNQTGCHVDGFVRVPMVDQPDQDVVTSQLDQDITLTWGTPDCKKCEADGVSCGFADKSTQLTKCFVHSKIPVYTFLKKLFF
jgi:hypothetical protein